MIKRVLELIQKQLNGFLQNIDVPGDQWVVLSNVVNHEGHPYEDAQGKIVMFLANITHETTVSTYHSTARAKSGGGYVAVQPPLYIDLFVLFFANFYDRQYSEGLRMISRIVGFFQQNPIFTHDTMPDLDPSIDKLTIEMVNLDLVEINYLMGAVGAKYLPSVFYKLRMIPFDGGAMRAEVPAARGVKTSGASAP
jgi:hypothetical protein